MVFDSFSFLVFFCTFFLLYWFVFDKKLPVQNFLILAASYIFYSWWDWRFLIVLVANSLINYLLGYYMGQTQNKKTKKWLLYAGVIYGVGTLLYFKYTNFFISSLIDAFAKFNIHLNIHTIYIVLPLGISFYTFKTLSYLFDIYKNKIQPTSDWVIFFSYTAFFPCLISGPIDRSGTLIPQLSKKREFNYDLAADGMRQILWGSFKKTVIADSCSLLTDDMFVYYKTLPASSLVLGAFYFTIQVYANFSGYSDMVIGFAKVLGFNVTRNFDYPFFSQNIAEFWRKWHISLTSWLTEYLFIPLTTKLSWSGQGGGDGQLAVSTGQAGVFGTDNASTAPTIKTERATAFNSGKLLAILNKEVNPELHSREFKPIHQLINEIAAKTPDQIAIKFQKQNISYGDLNKKANRLAALLIRNNIKKGDKVAFALERSVELITVLLAIIKSGGVYVPLDPQFPADRLNFMLADSGASILLTSKKHHDHFTGNAKVLVIEDEWPKLHQQADTDPEVLINAQDQLYMLYTSGSTGQPKGVLMNHRALVNLLAWQKEHSLSAAGVNTLQFAPLGFDVSFQEIFSTLTTGGTIVPVEEGLRLDPYRLLRYIDENAVNRVFVPFVVLQYLTEAADVGQFYPASLKEVMTAGEQLKVTRQIVKFFEALPGCVLFNQYGPTETHVVTQLKLDGKPSAWPPLPSIGMPIDHTTILILDEELNELPYGEAGELCVSGLSLADGYLNRPKLTDEKFIYHTSAENKTIRIYRTGDLARFMPDGNIEYLGRKDAQVKIRGNRVEPGEIEVVLNRLTAIQQAIVVAKEAANGQKSLVAYLVPAKSEHDTALVKQAVAAQLPDFMVPSAFVWLDELPKTTSGKVDRKALAQMPLPAAGDRDDYIAPHSPMEQLVVVIWTAFLGIDKISVKADFFKLGGNSLIAVQVMTRIEKQTGKRLPLSALFNSPTVKKLAQQVEGAPTAGKKSRPVFSKAGLIASTIITLTIAGIWHGANWNFVLFGFIHGCYFIPLILNNKAPKNKNTPTNKLRAALIKLAKTLGTFILVMFTFVIFWADSIRHAFSYLYRVFSWSLFTNPLHALPPHRVGFLLPAIAVLLVVEWIQRKKQFALQIEDIKYTWVRWAIYMLILGICLSNMSEASKFIYAKF